MEESDVSDLKSGHTLPFPASSIMGHSVSALQDSEYTTKAQELYLARKTTHFIHKEGQGP